MTVAPLSAVLFDAGDVLYDATAWRRWLAERLSASGVDVTYPLLVERWEAQLVDVYTGRVGYWDRFRCLLSDFDIPDADLPKWEAAARAKGSEVQEVHRAFDGTREMLEALRARGLRLGVLSDTQQPAEDVRRKLDGFGLDGLFDAVVTSIDIGHVKPEREAYQEAANAVGSPLARCAFVAHDVDELEGAQEAGMWAIAFNAASGVPCDAWAESPGDLVELVNSRLPA